MLSAAFFSGLAATAGALGKGGDNIIVLLLLAAAAVLSARPLFRLAASGDNGRNGRKVAVATLFGAHLIATLFFFPPGDLINDKPVLTLDHAIHYQQAVRAREVFHRSFRLHTYDPYFMAGYPGGTVFDIDSKGLELWCALSGPIGTPRAFKIFIIIGHLLLPFTVYAGCRRLGFDFRESVASTLILMMCWHWGRPYIGEFRFAGMFACLTIAHVSLYLAGLFRSFLRGRNVPAFWIVGPLAFLVHPTPAVQLPVFFIALFLVERKSVPAGIAHTRWEIRILSRMVLWCLLVLAVNAIWLIPFFRYLDIKTPSETFFQIRGLSGLLGLLIKPGDLPAVMLMILAAAGAVSLMRGGRSSDAVGPAAGSLFLLVIAAFGIYIPLFDQMEPGRFLVPALVFMAPLAGPGLISLMRITGSKLPADNMRKHLAGALVLVLLISTPVFSLLASRMFYRHAVSTEIVPEASEMIEALKKYTDSSGRLMMEDGPAWNFGEMFLPAIVPFHTGVEQIGGPYPWAFIRHNFTNFHMCRAMGKRLPDTDPDEFMRYLELYNVRWILTSTPDCTEYVAGFIGSDPLWASKNFTIWATGIPDPAVRGMVINADYGMIEVGFRSEVPEKVTLPYHWDRGLRVAPPAVIYGEQRMDDPVPFIVLEPRGRDKILIEFQ